MATLLDYERAWLRLKVVIAEKPSHGRRDLRDAMGAIEVECLMDETLRTPPENDQQDPSPLRAAG